MRNSLLLLAGLALGAGPASAQSVPAPWPRDYKIDGWSIGLFLAGASALISVLGYLVVIAGAFQPLSHVLSTTSLFAESASASNLGPVLYAIAMSIGAAFIVARGCDREDRIGDLPPFVARLAHWSTLALGVVIGLGVMFATARMVTHLQFRLPAPGHRYLLAIGAQPGIKANLMD